LLLLLLLIFALHLSLSGQRQQILKKKSKIKKKGVRIQAIIGRIQTPDPDPGHFGRILIPDPVSNPHLQIPVPVRRAALTHSRFVDFYGLFSRIWTQFLVEIHILRDQSGTFRICHRGVCEEGGICFQSKSGLKKKSSIYWLYYL